MATGNFYKVNTDYIYAISDNDYIDIEDIAYTLQEEYRKYDVDFDVDFDIESDYDNRSYPTSSLGSITSYVSTKDCQIGISINSFLRSGYYSGACLDYEVTISTDNDVISDSELRNYSYEEIVQDLVYDKYEDDFKTEAEEQLDNYIINKYGKTWEELKRSLSKEEKDKVVKDIDNKENELDNQVYEKLDKMSEEVSKELVGKIEDEVHKLIQITEKVYSKVSQQLTVCCAFSNGETIYESVND